MENQENHSVWQRDPFPFLSSLSSHESADVCVVGAGIAGLTTAYELLESDRSVVVIDRGAPPAGETAFTSAHLSYVLGTRYTELASLHGEDGARLVATSHARAIDEIERIVQAEGIEAAFARVPGHLFLGVDRDEDELHREVELLHRWGRTDVEFLDGADSPFFATGPCVRFARQARFEPLRYLAGLTEAVLRKGGKVFSHTEAMQIEGGHPARVSTNRGFQVVCEAVVVATNVPCQDRVTMVPKMAPYRTYVVALEVPAGHTDTSLFWDTEDPYHYIRSHRLPDGRTLAIIGGEDHRVGQASDTADRFARLRTYARERLGLKGPVRAEWSGQVLESHDGIAYLGRNPHDAENVFIVTGDCGNGLTHGTVAALLFRDLINGRENPWAKLYDPSRVVLRSLPTFLSENAMSTAPYTDWVSPGDVSSAADIPAGEGAVLRDGIQKIAVYKDAQNHVHCFSAVCPHLSGIVRWNSAEKTWDCPCHGSRFDRMGRRLNGPANTGLRAIEGESVPEADAASA